MNARDLMTANPYFIRTTTPIREGMEMMMELDVRHLPVVENGEVVGMVSSKDFRALSPPALLELSSLTAQQDALDAPVATVMTGAVLCVDLEADIVEVIDLMVTERVGAVPVIDRDTRSLEGILSYIDVLSEAASLF